MAPNSFHDYARITGLADDGVVGWDSLISRYKLDEGSGTTAIDSKGSNDGTINGATWTSDSKSAGKP